MTSTPDTIVLIHGLWMTPRSWEHWITRFESRGFKVIAPAYPGFEVEVEALRKDPSVIAKTTITDTVDHYEKIIRGLGKPPIIMGHSFGGTITQLLLDRGVCAAAVCVNSALVRGIKIVPLSQARSLFPFLSNPARRNEAIGFTPEQFHYAFTNVISEDESQKLFDRYHIPAPANIIWDGVLANFKSDSPAAVDFKRARGPLLFIAGGEDHIMPAAVNRSNYHHYSESPSITNYIEFADRPHFMVGLKDWETIADTALAWAVNNSPKG